MKRKNNKTLRCSQCSAEVKNCGIDAVSVTCHKCVSANFNNWNKNNSELTTQEYV